MMKLKVDVLFKDKNNGRIYKKGEVVEFENKRAKELLADKRNLVSEVKEPKKAVKNTAEK